ncbi:MAG: aminotransferase class III-fold pyridoxal phosphate-dependent enzyme [Chloroflexi bacterium]|nr:aminotransferase class III-fold pyridoxal phosphate-dependent enzyme [Chloroflexota bacterium]
MPDNLTAHLSPVWTRLSNILVDHGEGAYLYDVAGRRYLDFTCGIAVTNTGHCHPKVVSAIQTQAGRLLHGQINIVYHQPALDLVAELLPVTPTGLDSFFFSNSGAEAIEAAVKLAKQATGRPNIIVFNGSFHGRTHLTMAMTTSKTIYRVRYQPLVPGIFVAPYPYAYYYGLDPDAATDFCTRELKRLLKSQTAPEETACMVVEPVLGEGGYVAPPPRFLAELRRMCDETGILLVADEIQTGFGRTGRFFAVEHAGVTPDILVMAKGIASGLPLSCVATRRELAARWQTGSHGGTYGCNAVACAAAAATLRVIKEEGLVENAAARGNQLMAGLHRLQADFPVIGDVRGLGLMVGVEFTRDGQPDTVACKAVVKACQEDGLLLLTCGTYDNVVRWIPPLIVTPEQIAEGLRIFAAALDRF